MTDSIFRLTNPVDTEASVDSTEKIIFNTGTVPDDTGKLVRTGVRAVTDLNPHPNPRRTLNFIQDGQLGVLEVTIAGYFKKTQTTLGPKNLLNWSIEGKQNDDFEAGRFGLTLDSFSNGLLNKSPTVGLNGTGYMLSEFNADIVEDKNLGMPFIVKLFRNGRILPIP